MLERDAERCGGHDNEQSGIEQIGGLGQEVLI